MSVDNRPWPLSAHLPSPPHSLHEEEEEEEEEEETTDSLLPSFFPTIPSSPDATQQDRKRSRVSSLQLCYSRAWLGQGHIEEYHLTPEEKVRRAIDTVVDNGYEQVDLSHCDLVEIPEGIIELQHITVLRKDTVKTASLQLYLFANQLKSLSPTLFQLKNLTVLSLRCNNLTFIPPDIALLENLVELSLGNNNLTYLPSELRLLPKLTLLSVCPNPFIPKPIDSTTQSVFPLSILRSGQLSHQLPSLFEIACRQHLRHPFTTTVLPYAIQQILDSISLMNRCYTCQRQFVESTTQEMIWMDIINVKWVPLLFRFCSINCVHQLVL